MVLQLRRIITLVTAGSLVLSASAVLPHAWLAGRLLLDRPDAHEIAAYKLSRLSTADYEPAIEEVLASGDVDLASSMVDLAQQNGLVLREDLVDRVEAEAASSALNTASDTWEGFISGEATSEAALGGAIAADIFGYGDIRDLSAEAKSYWLGEPVDQVTVALASAGLILTGATIYTFGAPLPAKAGLSTIKLARRAGKLSAGLVADVAGMARRSVNDRALADVWRAAKGLDPTAMLAATKNLVRPEAVKTLTDLGGDVSTIGSKAGYRGVIDVLEKAENVDGVRLAARVSSRYGKGARGALHFTGRMTLTLGSLLFDMLAWLLTSAIWLLGALWVVFRLTRWASRRLRNVLATSRP